MWCCFCDLSAKASHSSDTFPSDMAKSLHAHSTQEYQLTPGKWGIGPPHQPCGDPANTEGIGETPSHGYGG